MQDDDDLSLPTAAIDDSEALTGERPTEDDYVRKPNFPPGCPIMYHNIKFDVRNATLRKYVWQAYIHWYVLCFVYVWNLLAQIAVMISSFESSNIIGVALAILYLILGVPLSFLTYLQLYRAASKVRAVGFTFYCCLFALQGAFNIFCALGIPHSGGSGLVLMIDEWEVGANTTAIMQAISFLFWVAMTGFNVYFLIALKRVWAKATSASLGDQLVDEAADAVGEAAWENREAIAEAAWENRETIAKAAWDNRQHVVNAAASVSTNNRAEDNRRQQQQQQAQQQQQQEEPSPALISLQEEGQEIPKEFL